MTTLAVIFDMDGLLLDSEPLWQRAEIEVFGAAGLRLTPELCRRTAGLRVDEVVRYWQARGEWPCDDVDAFAGRIVDRVAALVESEGALKPGSRRAIETVRRRGVKVALASSSQQRLIDAALARFGLAGAFDAVHSAETESHGKPHPAIYLSTAATLGVAPGACLAIEDSLFGVIAAKAARMRCIAVPEGENGTDPRFALADMVLPSLVALDDAALDRAWAD